MCNYASTLDIVFDTRHLVVIIYTKLSVKFSLWCCFYLRFSFYKFCYSTFMNLVQISDPNTNFFGPVFSSIWRIFVTLCTMEYAIFIERCQGWDLDKYHKSKRIFWIFYWYLDQNEFHIYPPYLQLFLWQKLRIKYKT